MIERLDLTGRSRRSWLGHSDRALEWPPDERPPTLSLYTSRKPLRKITVVIDSKLFPDSGERCPSSRSTLLANLLSHRLVRLYRYTDDGSPYAESADGRRDLGKGLLTVGDQDDKINVWPATFARDDGVVRAGIVGDIVDLASADCAADVYRDLDESHARTLRRGDALAAEAAAQAAEADLYITERDYLFASNVPMLARGTKICRPNDALPILGLYLRHQDEYLCTRQHRLNRRLFYWVGARELLSDGWRWFSACLQHSDYTSDDTVALQALSVLQRVSQALRTRDAVHFSLNQAQSNDTVEEALTNLTTTLFILMGAVDATARVSHHVLQLGGNERQAAWHRVGIWIEKVRKAAPNLSALVAPGTAGNSILEILARLRNSVHGAALQGVVVVKGGEPKESLVGLPAEDEAEVIAAMDRTGGQDAWGIRQALPGRIQLDPGVFVDRLTESVVELLNQIMRESPVENLPGVAAIDERPPFDPPFDERTRTNVRWQLGF